MKLNKIPRKPVDADTELWYRQIAQQVNGISEGAISANYNAQTAAPTTGTYAKGDFIRNSNPTEQNTGGLKYVLYGWECVSGGTPGTWVECRFQTGGGAEITKLITTTATLDFPSISANSSADLSVTVTGAAIGDGVILVPPNDLNAECIFCGFVSAADTVKVRVHKASSGAVDLPSATWRITVMKFE